MTLLAPFQPGPPRDGVASVFEALVLGLKDYCRKCGFQKVVLGLSGSIDSAVTAVIAAKALGPQNVIGIAMPSRYSSQGSVTDAEALAGVDLLARTEGIIPALESAHAIAWLSREAAALAGQTVLVCLSGRGDKDVEEIGRHRGAGDGT